MPCQLVSNEHLDHVAALLDDIFRIPGTQIRFGLDALIGWVPGIGDAMTGIASFLIVFASWRRGAKNSDAGAHDRERAARDCNWRHTRSRRCFPRDLESESAKLPVADP